VSAGGIATVVVAGLVIAVIVGLARLGTGADLVLTYQDGRLHVRGRLTAPRANEVRVFFQRELRPKGKVTVRVDGPKGRTPRIRVSGALTKGEMQRVRNALTLILG